VGPCSSSKCAERENVRDAGTVSKVQIGTYSKGILGNEKGKVGYLFLRVRHDN
jgi:hypothetical protein